MARAHFTITGCKDQPAGIVTGFVGGDGERFYPTGSKREAFDFPTAGSARKAAKDLAAMVYPDQAGGAEVRIM